MRHGSLLAGAVALLAAGVVAGAGGRLLVAAAGGPAGLTPADGGAGRRAVPLAPVAACADTDLEGARLGEELARPWTKARRGPILSGTAALFESANGD